jgi:hypothetical protein
MMSRKPKTGLGWGQAPLAWTLMPTCVDQELATCGVLCIEEVYCVVGSKSCAEEGKGDGGDDDDEAEFYGSTPCV